jgi:PTH1 family peptidyl-tRNA hydrolase
VREREGGGHGGHNGLRDVMQRLGTGSFRRLRIGIGRPPGNMDAADYVLAKFRTDEFEAVNTAIDRAADLILVILREVRSKDPSPDVDAGVADPSLRSG